MTQDLLARAAADRRRAAEARDRATRKQAFAYLDHRDGRFAGVDALLVHKTLSEHHEAAAPNLTWSDFPHVRKCALVVQKVSLEGDGDKAVLTVDRQDWGDVIRVLEGAGIDVQVQHLD